MSTVYIVTSGSYSDYSINAVFSTEALADQYVAVHQTGPYDRLDVEEWTLDYKAPSKTIPDEEGDGDTRDQ